MSDNAIFLGKSDKREELFLPVGQSPRAGNRRHRHRQDRDLADHGREFLQGRRSGLCRRREGRSLRHLASGNATGFPHSSAPRKSVSMTTAWKPRRPSSGTCSASRAIPSAPLSPKWALSSCRASWASRKRRKARSTSPSALPIMKASALLDLKDLRALLADLADRGKEITHPVWQCAMPRPSARSSAASW